MITQIVDAAAFSARGFAWVTVRRERIRLNWIGGGTKIDLPADAAIEVWIHDPSVFPQRFFPPPDPATATFRIDGEVVLRLRRLKPALGRQLWRAGFEYDADSSLDRPVWTRSPERA